MLTHVIKKSKLLLYFLKNKNSSTLYKRSKIFFCVYQIMNFWKSSYIKLKQKLLKYFYIHQKRKFPNIVTLYFWSNFVVPYLIIFFLYLISLSLYCSRPYSSFFYLSRERSWYFSQAFFWNVSLLLFYNNI